MSLRAKAFARENERLRARLRKMSLRAKAFGRENQRLRVRLRTNEFAR